MLARPDAQDFVGWTSARISGSAWGKMNNVLVMGNGGRRNGVSVYGARNAQGSSTLVANAVPKHDTCVLGSSRLRIPLDTLWHGTLGCGITGLVIK